MEVWMEQERLKEGGKQLGTSSRRVAGCTTAGRKGWEWGVGRVECRQCFEFFPSMSPPALLTRRACRLAVFSCTSMSLSVLANNRTLERHFIPSFQQVIFCICVIHSVQIRRQITQSVCQVKEFLAVGTPSGRPFYLIVRLSQEHEIVLRHRIRA